MTSSFSLRFAYAPPTSTRWSHALQLAVFQNELITSPRDRVASKTAEPQNHRDTVANWNQREGRWKTWIAQHNFPHHPGHQHAEHERGRGQRPRPGSSTRCHQSEQCPGKPECKQQTEIAASSRVAHTASPTQLMVDKASKVIGRQNGFNNNVGQFHCKP